VKIVIFNVIYVLHNCKKIDFYTSKWICVTTNNIIKMSFTFEQVGTAYHIAYGDNHMEFHMDDNVKKYRGTTGFELRRRHLLPTFDETSGTIERFIGNVDTGNDGYMSFEDTAGYDNEVQLGFECKENKLHITMVARINDYDYTSVICVNLNESADKQEVIKFLQSINSKMLPH
jgi:hypothetical protein